MLSPMQARFVNEYLKAPNAEQAAIKAGYVRSNARFHAARLLTKANIREAIREGREAITEQMMLTVAEMIQELRWIARSDITDLLDDDGHIKPLKRLPKHIRRTISSIKVSRRTEGRGDDATEIEVTEFKLWPKLDAIEKICRHLAMYVDQDELAKLRGDIDELKGHHQREGADG